MTLEGASVYIAEVTLMKMTAICYLGVSGVIRRRTARFSRPQAVRPTGNAMGECWGEEILFFFS